MAFLLFHCVNLIFLLCIILYCVEVPCILLHCESLYFYILIFLLNKILLCPANEDFIAFVDEVVTLESGDERVCKPLALIQDDLVEGEEFLSVIISRASATLGPITRSQVEILDSDRKL